MKTILSFFAGICLVILTAAVTNITEIKPAQSKSVLIEKFYDFTEAKNAVFRYRKQGYILKQFDYEIYGNGGYEQIAIIMEKF